MNFLKIGTHIFHGTYTKPGILCTQQYNYHGSQVSYGDKCCENQEPPKNAFETNEGTSYKLLHNV